MYEIHQQVHDAMMLHTAPLLILDPGDVFCFHFEMFDPVIELDILSSANVCSRIELSGLLSTLTNTTTLFGSYSLSTAHHLYVLNG